MNQKPFNKLKNNEDGMIMITIIIILLIGSIVTVGLISLNSSQSLIETKEVKRIKSEEVAQGAIAYYFAEQTVTNPPTSLTFQETVDGLPYSSSVTQGSASGSVLNSLPINVNINYSN